MTSNRKSNSEVEPVAVVAIGSIFPGRGDTTGFWRDIVEGVDTFTSVPATHWLTDDYYDSDKSAPDRTYGSRGAFVPATSFDPLSFGIPPNSLSTTDTAQLLALVAARNVLDDIERETASPLDKSRASVILGVAATTELVGQMMGRLQRPTWVKGMREAGLDEALTQNIADRISSNFVEWRETTFPGLLGNVVAGRIANRLDFGGSNYVTDAACASSLSAMQIALHELHSGDSDLVLTGGVDALNDIFMYMCFSKTPALSPSGDCRPMSADADGTMLGEGVGMLALRRLSDAQRDGNRIHAIVKGLGGGSDGSSTAVYAPLATGQVRTLTRAYAKAGYSPKTVELVEAHGTGTVAGDRTEIEALHSVFDPENEAETPWCALGSVKSQIGHTKAAAGAAGLLKVINGLSRKVLPPTIKVRRPAEALCQNTPFSINTKARPWIRGSDHPRRASVSSFGFGGSNFHVTLEEYTGKQAVQPTRVMPAELLLVSAPTALSLCEQLDAFMQEVEHEDDLARIASESWARFDVSHEHRASIVAQTPEHLNKSCIKLKVLMEKGGDKNRPPDRHIHYRAGAAIPGKLALLFAGQGSQYVGMGADLAMAFPSARAVWDSACDIPATADLKLHDIAFPPTLFSKEAEDAAIARLTNMQHAQPAIAAVALSQMALLKQLGVQADMQAGHSFGEVMALHSAGVFDAPAALSIACERSLAMSNAIASTKGSMLAVRASAEDVNDVLAEANDGITLANDNGPEQVVLSGDTARLAQAASLLTSKGIHTQILPVAAAFHSPQVEPAIQPFAKKLAKHSFSKAATTVYANSTANPYPTRKAALIKLLSEQIGKPVLFRQSLEAMHLAGATTFLEVGPGSVLTNLVRQSLPDSVTAIALDDKHGNGTTAMLIAVAQLAVSGISVDVDSLYEGLPAPAKRKPPGKHSVDLLGCNYQKPYPPQGNQTVNSRPEHHLAQSFTKASALNGTTHQPSAAANPTMAMQKQPSETHDPAQCHQSQSISSAPQHNGVLSESPVTQAPPVSGSVRQALFNDVSARHSEYMAAFTAAHQSYLRLAAGLMDGVADTSSSMPEQQLATTSHVASARENIASSTPTAPVAPTSLNGHGQLNGSTSAAPAQAHKTATTAADYTSRAAPAVSNGAMNGVLTNGSVNPAAEIPTAQAAPMAAPASATINTTATHSASKLADDGAAQPRISTDIVRTLIADKTGYPVDMIEDDMDLSGELGIDSIKQVEVLSALRSQVPEIKDVGTADIGQLRTIRQIADFFG